MQTIKLEDEYLFCGICRRILTDDIETVQDVEVGTCCKEHYEDER